MKRKSIEWVTMALLLGTAVWMLTGGMALQTQENLADRLVRLHVLANSDTEEDQTLKLQVRDRVLEQARPLLAEADSREKAVCCLRPALPGLEQAAQEEIWLRGYRYPVKVELAETEFPTKEYPGFTLPAGKYLALRVLIGEAEGQNWWCVVFPPLCTAASTEVEDCALAAGLTTDQVGLITGENEGYVVKFKLVELWEDLRSRLEEGKRQGF